MILFLCHSILFWYYGCNIFSLSLRIVSLGFGVSVYCCFVFSCPSALLLFSQIPFSFYFAISLSYGRFSSNVWKSLAIHSRLRMGELETWLKVLYLCEGLVNDLLFPIIWWREKPVLFIWRPPKWQCVWVIYLGQLIFFREDPPVSCLGINFLGEIEKKRPGHLTVYHAKFQLILLFLVLSLISISCHAWVPYIWGLLGSIFPDSKYNSTDSQCIILFYPSMVAILSIMLQT